MAQLMEHIEYLSKEIGPRPAGTEEEQQAALYITEQLQKETGFTANIEEFAGSSNIEIVNAALSFIVVVATILAIIFPVVAIPAFVLAAIAAAVYTAEALDHPVVSRFLSKGASQNVVAKYQPNHDEAKRGRGRSRKIILVAHYDTGRVKPSIVSSMESLPIPLGFICVVAMIAAAFFLLVRIFIAPGGGMGLLVTNVLSIIAAVVCLLPLLKTILVRTAPYNEGAVNNASGSAALIEIARRISQGSVSEAELAQSAAQEGVVVYGEEAARAEGLVPEGAEITYEAAQTAFAGEPEEGEDYDEEARLLAAKAAIAALTGKPVESRLYGSAAKPEGDQEEQGASSAEGAVPSAEAGDLTRLATGEIAGIAELTAPAEEEADDAEGFENAPDWFVTAQQNARKAEGYNTGAVNVQRSKYTEAFDYAERERAAREEERRLAEQAQIEAEKRAREEEIRATLERAEEGRLSQIAASAVEQPGQAWPVEDNAEPFEAALPEAADGAATPRPLSEIPAVFDGLAPQVEEETWNKQELMGDLPAISASEGVPETTSPSRSGLLRNLRNTIPSKSGIMNPVVVEEPAPRAATDLPTITAEDAAADAALSEAAAPSISDIPGIVSDIPEIISVPDLQVAADEAPAPQTLAPAAESQPDTLRESTIAMDPIDYSLEFPLDIDERMQEKPLEPLPPLEPPASAVPRSRSGSLLDKFRRNRGEKASEELSNTPQEWLDVDEDFEARSVGRARGSWESFRDDQYFDDDDTLDEFGAGDEGGSGRRWQGGAYSRESLGRVNMRSGEESDADEPISEEPELTQDERDLTGEIEQIYHFRNPQFNMEIWFVAIGSDGAGHDGAKAFIDEHYDELRGSMFIEVESLGAGTLSVSTEEGRVSKVTASSRIKRFAREATATTGIALESVSLAGTDSISSTVQKAGFQAMHVFGAEKGRPALKGSADDVLENIDELLLDDHINYVYELLKR